jgi:hypothetical protein
MLPSERGLKEYPPNGYYMESEHGQEYPCICTEACPNGCSGQKCECPACAAAYGDFLELGD